MKQCKHCNKTKELKDFVIDKKCKDGTTYQCKDCKREYRKRLRIENPEAYAKRLKASKQWGKDHPLKVKENSKSDAAKKSRKKYKQSFKGKCSAAADARRRKNRKAITKDGTITTKALVELMINQDGKCAYCSVTLDTNLPFSVHLDHIEPLAIGGLHSISNVVWSCKQCNLLKGSSAARPKEGIKTE